MIVGTREMNTNQQFVIPLLHREEEGWYLLCPPRERWDGEYNRFETREDALASPLAKRGVQEEET